MCTGAIRSDASNDMDELLNLEEIFYKEGYEEGLSVKAGSNFMEGKQYGLQVGFQRFLLLGEIEGYLNIVETWKVEGIAFTRNLETLRSLLKGIRLDNSDATVADFDSRFLKIKNKFRTLLLLIHRQSKERSEGSFPLECLEKMSARVGGELKSYVEDHDSDDNKNINNKNQDW